MSLSLDLVTKLPGVGSSIEAVMIGKNYLDSRERNQEKQHRLGIIRRGLEEQRRGGCLYPSQQQTLDERIQTLNNQINQAEEEMKQEGINALTRTGVVILQEGANAVVPGGGSIVAGVMRARTAAMETPGCIDHAVREGVREGLQDYGLTFAVEQLSETSGCSIM